MQQKTRRPVQFEITEPTRKSIAVWMQKSGLASHDYLFSSRLHESQHLSTRQYARIVHQWVEMIGLEGSAYGTHTMRRTKASLIYRRTKNLRAVQLLLGHTKLESTVRYLGIEVDDALEIAEQTEVLVKQNSAQQWALFGQKRPFELCSPIYRCGSNARAKVACNRIGPYLSSDLVMHPTVRNVVAFVAFCNCKCLP